MIALDTNVLVRIVTRDDPEQTQAALALLRGKELWLAKTVLLELEWVLRFSYELDREAVLGALRGIVGLRRLHVEDRQSVVLALEWYAGGMDFADALHLAASAATDGFATFDRKLAATAARLDVFPRVELVGGG
ncbi:MAG: type II toxin-antitoxin system VapC family toxin [Thermoanaerobaculia bacterium]|nr:type II toxin-antitoxin system VapC family toxin [Thermoanaerobaculia bacterium]